MRAGGTMSKLTRMTRQLRCVKVSRTYYYCNIAGWISEVDVVTAPTTQSVWL